MCMELVMNNFKVLSLLLVGVCITLCVRAKELVPPPPIVKLHSTALTVNSKSELLIDFVSGQRGYMSSISIFVPQEMNVSLTNTTVDVIGRGEVPLCDLAKQSIGRTASSFSYQKVGDVELRKEKKQTVIVFKNIDLRPFNGIDLRLRFKEVNLPKAKEYPFEAEYVPATTRNLPSHQQGTAYAAGHGMTSLRGKAILQGVKYISDLRRATQSSVNDLTTAYLHWTTPKDARLLTLQLSEDEGNSWRPSCVSIDKQTDRVEVPSLKSNTLYTFRLKVKGGAQEGYSNEISLYTGEWNVKQLGLKGDDYTDDTDALNAAIQKVHLLGGGTLYFPDGNYLIRTAHLLSNVWMHIAGQAVIKALPGADAPEDTWFIDCSHNAGNSSMDTAPYKESDNYLIKQDVGHSFFHNCMFFAERAENIRIWGTGRITGGGNIETGNGVMNNPPERRSDKMFVFKLCRNIELGGVSNGRDMWYDEATDEPCYLEKDGSKKTDIDNMLDIDQGGHFVILATGTDHLYVHDIYCGKHSLNRARDIFDFMGCCDVTVNNIFSRVNGDDIVKLGSDCSLGFTRPARNYLVRNIVGDTNCNVFQIGSETADDIQDVYVDNMYVLATNKAGFSISTNDGGHVRNIYLNSGKTGSIHSRSIMKRVRTPFFLSISNRGRVLGADASLFNFKENGTVRTELLVTNSNIGKVENIVIRGVDVEDVYAGSSYYNKVRWKSYDGTQPESAPIIAGFKLPDEENVIGGLNFSLPNGKSVGYIENVFFHDVRIKVKGRHPAEDANLCPPEIGVGNFNVRDLKIQPSFGFWARHVKDLIIEDCSIETEAQDGRYPILLHNVKGARINKLKVAEGCSEQRETVKMIDCYGIKVED